MTNSEIAKEQVVKHYDVIIAGAGMAGTLLAISIAQLAPKLNLLLLDANSPLPDCELTAVNNPSFDARSIALSAGSVKVLTELNLWPEIQSFAQAIKHIQVSDKGHWSALELPSGTHPFGYVVELKQMGRVLASCVKSFTSIDLLYESEISALEQQQAQVKCQLHNGQSLSASLIVGADGTFSKVRELAKIPKQLSDYQRSAIICNIRVSQVHQGIAYERFCGSGPIALLPLQNDLYSVVLCVDNNQLTEFKSLSDSEFLAKLQQQFGYRAGVFVEVGQRDIYPLLLMKTEQPTAHRVVCIGNAAHCLHPVAGQGFNLGLRDLYVLATTIANNDVADIGSYSMLKQYWQYRQQDHHNTILMTDGLVRLFSNNNLLLTIARNIGLQMMSLLPFLSDPIIKQSKGQFELFNKEKKA